MQIDVLSITQSGHVVCNLQTGDRDVRVLLHEADYQDLIADGFFIRDGKSKDSAGVLNTTKDYHL